jgi:glycosyltransferase involved in cell wall biosynthesis
VQWSIFNSGYEADAPSVGAGAPRCKFYRGKLDSDMPRVLLLGNYPADNQPSMLRYSRMLRDELIRLGCDVDLIKPPVVINKRQSGPVSKWLGYVDKYVLFRQELERTAAKYDIIHVTDHSNAVYVPWIKNKPTVVTCHDMLAVRGALGEDTDCPASPTGKILQRWILHGLSRASERVCISDATRDDVIRLLGPQYAQSTTTIKLWLESTARVLSREEALARIPAVNGFDPSEPFILHVGSNLARKNRDGIIRIFSRLKDRFAGKLVFAGAALTSELRALATKHGVADRVIEIVRPTDEVIEALYNLAFAFLFPSKFEGFGWPLIEAQACGCPVVCGSNPPLPEVVLDSAIKIDVNDEQGFADALVSLTDPTKRDFYREKGLQNVERYSATDSARNYLRIYSQLVDEPFQALEVS